MPMYAKKIGSIQAVDADLPSFKDLNRQDILKITDITDEEREKLYRFIDLVPDSDTCIHGDLNINNIMVQNGECCLIDMGEFSTGLRMFDVSRIVFSMKYGKLDGEDFNSFYKLPTVVCDKVFEQFMQNISAAKLCRKQKKNTPRLNGLNRWRGFAVQQVCLKATDGPMKSAKWQKACCVKSSFPLLIHWKISRHK